MASHFSVRAFVAACILIPLAGCTNSIVDSITVSPTVQSLAVGQTVQFKATGVFTHRTASATSQDLTNQVIWSSSVPAIASVNAAGLATAVSAGTTTITATTSGFGGTLTATATITVTGLGSGTGSVANVTSLAVIPNSQSVSGPGQTGQFIAIGTTSSGSTANLTSQVSWSSSSAQIATINSSGLATAIGQGTSTITALYTNPGGGNTVTGTATFTVTSGASQQFTNVTIIPSSQSVSASGQKGQFIALATMGSTGFQQDVTNSAQIQWQSSIPSVASITSGLSSGNGLATGASVGTSTITAILKNSDGSIVSNTATVNVNTSPAPEPLLSLSIVPGSISVGNLQGTGQFLAVGTFSQAPYVRDLTNSVTWLSAAPNIFPVVTGNGSTANPGVPAGTVTAYGNGKTTIIAEAADPTTGSIQTATADFACPLVLPTATTAGSCYPGSQAPALLATVTIYNEGLNTTDWQVTGPSATGTPNVIHCGPGWTASGGTGGSVCVATYPIGSTVTLSATNPSGTFGGWSSTCSAAYGGTSNPNPSTAAGPNTCSFTISGSNPNVSVGVIFN